MGAGNSAAMPMMTALSPWLRAIILPSLILLSCQPVLAAEEKIIAGENEDKPAVKSSSSQAATTAVNFQGTYSAVVTGGTIGLHLEQAGEKVTGRLKGINAVYEMTGSLGRMAGSSASPIQPRASFISVARKKVGRSSCCLPNRLPMALSTRTRPASFYLLRAACRPARSGKKRSRPS